MKIFFQVLKTKPMLLSEKGGLFSLRTVRTQLYLAVSTFFIITSLMVLSVYWFEIKEDRVERMFKILSNLNLKFKEISKLEKDFFSYETENLDFFETQESRFLTQRKMLVHDVQDLLTELRHIEELHPIGIGNKIELIQDEIVGFNEHFDTLVHLIKMRGFHEQGLEGEMLSRIRAVENSPFTNQQKVGEIRKAEKNFFLRKRSDYVGEVKTTVAHLKADLENPPQHPEKQKVIENLDDYLNDFIKISEIERTVGFHNHSGLKNELIDLTDIIERQIQEISTKVFIQAEDISHHIKIILILVMILGISLNILLGYFVTLRLGQPILQLSDSIHQVTQAEFSSDVDIALIHTKDEIGMLSKDISLMLNRLRENRENLQRQNEIVTEKNAILEQQKREIILQTETLQRTVHKLNNKNTELNEALRKLKNAQAQLVQSEKMAGLGLLTAGIAHEINNPVNFVYAGTNALQMSIDDIFVVAREYNSPLLKNMKTAFQKLQEIEALKEELEFEESCVEAREILNDIQKGAERTAEIVKGLRTFSRLDEDALKQIDLHEGIDATLIILRNRYKDYIEIIKNYDATIPKIECYPGKLNQVFMNLLANAVQAIEGKGKITITTSLSGELDKKIDRRWVHISIKDTGVGIPKKNLEKIFEPFFTTKAVGNGTGLGLSISFGIIESHKGTIQVHSEIGKGTEFVVTIPVSPQNIDNQ